MKGTELYDKERAHFNRARLKRGGEKFEVIIQADNAVAFKRGSLKDVKDTLMYEKIFSDAKKGMMASETSIQNVFNTTDTLKVAETILKDGEIQLTSQYRNSLREAKHKQLIELIHRNAIDSRTNLPHPVTRIENAFKEAKINVDENKTAENQLDDVVKQLRVIMPIRFETMKLQLVIPSRFASKSHSILKNAGRLVKDSWQADGTLFAVVEIAAGLQQDMVEQLNKLTHGDVDIKVLEK